MTTKHGKHKRLTITCHTCGYSFTRQARRVHAHIFQYCRPCKTKRLGKITYWPSHKLLEVMHLEGQTAYGTDYEKYLPEIKEEYYRRQNKEVEEQINNNIEETNECPF